MSINILSNLVIDMRIFIDYTLRGSITGKSSKRVLHHFNNSYFCSVVRDLVPGTNHLTHHAVLALASGDPLEPWVRRSAV